jgi:excisionase family DNA binding protein
MYAAIRRYRLDSKYSDEVIRQIVENFVPRVRESEGLLGYYILDVGDGTFATITICENQAEVEESSKKATEWMKQYLASTILSQEEIPNFSVKVEETLQGTLYEGAPGSTHSQVLKGVRELSRREVSQSSDSQGLNLLSFSEVCLELGMSKSWVYRKIRSKEIPSIKLGHNIKVKREDLEEYIANQS